MASHSPTPEEMWEEKMKSLTKSVIKSGKLKTRRRVGQRVRKRDKYFLNKVIGEWAQNSVFIDNQKLIVQPLENSPGDNRLEIMLSSIKHVLPGEDSTDFALTWVGVESAATISPAKIKQKQQEKDADEFEMGFGMSMSDEEDDSVTKKDQVLVFRADTPEEAKTWINALNRAIQVTKSTQATASSQILREYSFMGEMRPSLTEISGTRKRKNRNQLSQASRIWAMANKEAKKLPPGVQAAFRTVGAIAATMSTVMVGGFFKSLMKAGVAPGWMKRLVSDSFQRVWLEAVAWMSPPILFHMTGDIPTAVKNSGSRKSSKRASKRRSSTRDPPVRVILLNSLCECDLVFTMMLAKAIDESHGSVKGFISHEERNQLLGLGAVFELFGFLFLSRKEKEERQELDKKRIAKHLQRLIADKAYEWIVIFPERGWPNKKAIEAQDDDEKNSDRPSLDLLLLPNSNELSACLDKLDGRSNVQVFDFTVAFEGYDENLPETEKQHVKNKKVPTYKNLLAGDSSNSVHIDSKLFSIDEIVGFDGGISKWLDSRWERKDELLKHFATYQVFPPDEDKQGQVKQDAFSVEGNLLPMIAIWIFNLITFSFVFVYLI